MERESGREEETAAFTDEEKFGPMEDIIWHVAECEGVRVHGFGDPKSERHTIVLADAYEGVKKAVEKWFIEKGAEQ